MTDYKKMIDDALESDVYKGTSKIKSVMALINSDSDLSSDEKQNLLMYPFEIMIKGINEYKKRLLIDPKTTDDKIKNYNGLIDGVIESIENPKNKFDINLN